MNATEIYKNIFNSLTELGYSDLNLENNDHFILFSGYATINDFAYGYFGNTKIYKHIVRYICNNYQIIKEAIEHTEGLTIAIPMIERSEENMFRKKTDYYHTNILSEENRNNVWRDVINNYMLKNAILQDIVTKSRLISSIPIFITNRWDIGYQGVASNDIFDNNIDINNCSSSYEEFNFSLFFGNCSFFLKMTY